MSAIDHASLARQSRGSAYSSVAYLSRMAIDHASLARRVDGKLKRNIRNNSISPRFYNHDHTAVIALAPNPVRTRSDFPY